MALTDLKALPNLRSQQTSLALWPQGIEDIGKLVDVFVGLEQQKMTRVKEANKLVNQIRVRTIT